MKNILIINCHPNKESFNHAIIAAYKAGAEKKNVKVDILNISELKFNPILEFGYQKRTELEPDLLMAWEKIKMANHLVIFYPIWWGGLPGYAKSFFDRLFLPGMVFKYKENSVWWDKLLSDKTAHVITTMDTPAFYFWLVYRNSGINQLKKNILEFCGIKVKNTTVISPIRNSSKKFREKWIKKVEQLGEKLQ